MNIVGSPREGAKEEPIGKKDKKNKKIALDEDAKDFGHNPFAAAFGGEPDPKPADASPAKDEEAVPADLSSLGKIVLRRERKGRGGKTVTIIEGLEALTPASLDELAKELRKTLGTGSTVEGDTIVLQGDQRDRLEPWFSKQGVTRIVRSG